MNRTALCSFFLALILSAAANPQTKPSPAGHWEGGITTPAGDLKVIVDLDRDAKGAWIGDIDIPDQNAKDLPLRKIVSSGESVSFELSAGMGEPTFKGRLSADGTTLSGNFVQAGNSVPFSLKRTGDANVHLPPASAAVPDKFTGRWEGNLDTPGGSLKLVFNLVNKEGSATGTIDSPDQGAMGIPMSEISTEENSISIGVKAVMGEYKGRLSEDGKTLTGEWSQGGSSLTLVLKKK